MAFVEIPVGDAKEPEVVPEGTYELRCDGYSQKRNKDDNRDMTLVTISILNPPAGINPEAIFHNISHPNKEDTEKSRMFQILLLRRFLEAFKIPYESGGFDPDDIPGSTAKCLVVQSEYEGRVRNDLELPPLKKEESNLKKPGKKVA